MQHRQERPTPSCPLDRMFCTATSFVDTPTVGTGRFDPISPLPPSTSERNSTPTTWTCFPEASRHNIICSSAAATRNRSEHAYVVLITKKIKSNQIKSMHPRSNSSTRQCPCTILQHVVKTLSLTPR